MFRGLSDGFSFWKGKTDAYRGFQNISGTVEEKLSYIRNLSAEGLANALVCAFARKGIHSSQVDVNDAFGPLPVDDANGVICLLLMKGDRMAYAITRRSGDSVSSSALALIRGRSRDDVYILHLHRVCTAQEIERFNGFEVVYGDALTALFDDNVSDADRILGGF